MLTNKSTVFYTICLLFFVFGSFAKSLKVYKHVDKSGIIHYSDRKPVGKSFTVLMIRCPECRAWRNSINWKTTPLINDKFNREIELAANKWGVEKPLLKAVIHVESAFKYQAVSSAGAQGLMQLMPVTQNTYEVKNPFDPEQNINGGAAYLKHLKDTYKKIDIYLAAYNSGETAVERYGKTIPPFPETKEYVRRVKILFRRYKQQGS